MRSAINYLYELVRRYAIPAHARIGPESSLAITCADFMRVKIGAGKMTGFFIHPMNENASSRLTQLVKIAEGVVPGASDFLIFWNNNWEFSRIIAVEIKIGKNKQTDKQKIFQLACEMLRIPYHVCRTFQEFEDVLKKYEIVH